MREVWRAQVLERREQLLGALLGLRKGEPLDGRPVHDARLPLATQAAALANEELGDVPIAIGPLLDAGIDDGHACARAGPRRVDEGDLAVEELADDQGLA